ncbi:MAG: aspartate/glutamate racemase family protein, partial [Firmicutes bacterium]|nr:aspartate/glutamate racemase family protein [Bacillota bacterium]
NPDIKVVSKACPLFVPMVECGYIDKTDEITRAVCRRYLPEIAESRADTLILGCTHYPIIEEAISAELPGVTLINTGAEAARKAAELLGASPESAGSTRYYVSDDVSMFNATASVFLGTGIDGKVERVSVG